MPLICWSSSPCSAKPIRRVLILHGWAIHGIIFEYPDESRSGLLLSDDGTSVPLTDDNINERKGSGQSWREISHPKGTEEPAKLVGLFGNDLKGESRYLCHSINLVFDSGQVEHVHGHQQDWMGHIFSYTAEALNLCSISRIEFSCGRCTGVEGKLILQDEFKKPKSNHQDQEQDIAHVDRALDKSSSPSEENSEQLFWSSPCPSQPINRVLILYSLGIHGIIFEYQDESYGGILLSGDGSRLPLTNENIERRTFENQQWCNVLTKETGAAARLTWIKGMNLKPNALPPHRSPSQYLCYSIQLGFDSGQIESAIGSKTNGMGDAFVYDAEDFELLEIEKIIFVKGKGCQGVEGRCNTLVGVEQSPKSQEMNDRSISRGLEKGFPHNTSNDPVPILRSIGSCRECFSICCYHSYDAFIHICCCEPEKGQKDRYGQFDGDTINVMQHNRLQCHDCWGECLANACLSLAGCCCNLCQQCLCDNN